MTTQDLIAFCFALLLVLAVGGIAGYGFGFVRGARSRRSRREQDDTLWKQAFNAGRVAEGDRIRKELRIGGER